MDNLSVSRASVRQQSVILRRRDTWIMSWLYIGTFGSFIGYSAALPLLIKTQFPDVNPLQYAFLGPLVGSIARPVGGWLSDRVGGAKVTFWNFIVMIGAVFGVIAFLEAGMFGGFLAMFMLLFVTTGLGNGSTFRMVPAIFRAGRMAAAKGGTDEQLRLADLAGRREAAAVLAFSSAIGAYGGFFIPRGFAMSIREAGSITPALLIFVGFYVTCLGATWWWYMRRAPRRATAPVLADVKV
jgi:NNP family nitrate/nitrite transporter-like MFS transporter